MAFLNGLSYTENCYSCHYAQTERAGDITIDDSWGTELSGELSKGVSLALCQTEKGRELLDMMDFNFYDVDIDAAIIFVISLKQEVILKYEIKVDMEYLLTAGVPERLIYY